MPEEINRVVADHISDHLFAPTAGAMRNLNREGLGARSHLTGDIMVDALLGALEYSKHSTVLSDLNLTPDNFYLLTLHRPYTVDDPGVLGKVLSILSQLDAKVVFSVHPRTRNIIRKHQIHAGDGLLLTEPQGYIDFVHLQNNARKVITDSGGIQKEAFILSKPCITLRTETEWVETVESGWNRVVSPLSPELIDVIQTFKPPAHKPEIFGADVARKMAEIIDKFLR
jgi:UDP-N-acetylglucosamine 2-epimerase